MSICTVGDWDGLEEPWRDWRFPGIVASVLVCLHHVTPVARWDDGRSDCKQTHGEGSSGVEAHVGVVAVCGVAKGAGGPVG